MIIALKYEHIDLNKENLEHTEDIVTSVTTHISRIKVIVDPP